jgi:hypothetical protein
MPLAMEAIQRLGVIVEYIPAGCTGHVQPVDVGIGKPLKNRIRKHWYEWAVSQLPNSPVLDPTIADIAEWVVKSLRNFPPNIVYNSWRKQGFSYCIYK